MTNQLAVRNDLKNLLATPTIKSRFESVLGKNAGAFIAAVLNTAVSTPKIMECDPLSVINAALQAAVLRLSISPSLGQAAIIPYGKKAQFQIMVGGFIQLALRTNQYRYINTAKIYEGETIEEERLTGKMKLGGAKKSNKIDAWCGYFELVNGFSKMLVMSVAEIMEHAKHYSKSWKGDHFEPGSAWDTNFDKMCEKTVIKLLIKKYGILSDTLEVALNIENETGEEPITGEVVTADAITGEVIELSRGDPAQQLPEDEKTVQQVMTELGYS